MEFDLTKTAVVFLALIAIGIAPIAIFTPMATTTVMMMVLPSAVVFGFICLVLGVKHGEYRASGRL